MKAALILVTILFVMSILVIIFGIVDLVSGDNLWGNHPLQGTFNLTIQKNLPQYKSPDSFHILYPAGQILSAKKDSLNFPMEADKAYIYMLSSKFTGDVEINTFDKGRIDSQPIVNPSDSIGKDWVGGYLIYTKSQYITLTLSAKEANQFYLAEIDQQDLREGVNALLENKMTPKGLEFLDPKGFVDPLVIQYLKVNIKNK